MKGPDSLYENKVSSTSHRPQDDMGNSSGFKISLRLGGRPPYKSRTHVRHVYEVLPRDVFPLQQLTGRLCLELRGFPLFKSLPSPVCRSREPDRIATTIVSNRFRRKRGTSSAGMEE